MRFDKPKSGFFSKITKTVAVLAALEVGAVIVSYCIWKRKSPDQDFQQYMTNNVNYALEKFFETKEVVDTTLWNSFLELDEACYQLSEKYLGPDLHPSKLDAVDSNEPTSRDK